MSTEFRISQAAALLGVSDDTMRRWADAGRIATHESAGGRRVVSGADLAALAQDLAAEQPTVVATAVSARNRLRGIVTAVVKDTVMAQVDIQCGPFRVVSLMSREAVDDLDLQVGSVAIAVIKSTTVVVERSTPAAAKGRTGS
jgi:molybdopterin-binding protein